ncbi:MAG: hypothetical protein ABI615_08090 [Chthoniobacterales bacterium]
MYVGKVTTALFNPARVRLMSPGRWGYRSIMTIKSFITGILVILAAIGFLFVLNSGIFDLGKLLDDPVDSELTKNILQIYDKLEIGMDRSDVEVAIANSASHHMNTTVAFPGEWKISPRKFMDAKQIYLTVQFSDNRVSKIKIHDNEIDNTPSGYPPAKELK